MMDFGLEHHHGDTEFTEEKTVLYFSVPPW